MAYDISINFRATSGYVTDPTDSTYCLGEAYPTTRSTVGTGQSVTFGWDVSVAGSARDRDSGINPKLAGINGTISTDTRVLRVDLPESGTFTLYGAFGDPIYAQRPDWDILDSDGTTVLLSQAETAVSAGNWKDATGVTRTSSADWVSNNAGVSVALTGSTVYLRHNPVASESAVVSNLRFVKAGGGGATISTITGTTVTEASSVVFTTTMSGTGGGTFAYSWSGTATSADYTSTLTTGMCAVTGGSGSVTVSGSNITVDSTVTAFTVTVPTTTDTLDEADETIRLVIGGVTSSSGTITDDDTQPTCTISDATEVAGTVTFVATLSAASGRSLSFDYATADGTKTAGVDYTAASGTVTFAAGETTKDIVITAL